ncbi:hypothetical protein [Rhodoferax sp. UBA5149]|uniref:hypothetical protein n=1 Tax=Rhodoferax sp. UBA5149 TaxID=1947379 RepID=UPI0025D71A15|nr:hypothetical protein [Rhodoferax sp. UBA5149]
MSATTPTTEQLRVAVTEMHSMSQSAFTEISTFARLALASLETPQAYANIESLATVLSAIWGKAMDADNCIRAEAEGVGCNYVDEARRCRMDAERKASETTSGAGCPMDKPIPADRAYIALQASWEIDGISELVHDHMSLDPDNLPHRALLRRCKRLSSIIMSALGEPDMGCDKLELMLNDEEVAHV